MKKMKFKKKRVFFKLLLLLFLIAVGLFITLFNYYNSDNNVSSVPVSIVVPCYNSEIYLPNLFAMLKKQTFKNYEVIFVDNGSTDKTNYLIRNQALKDKRIKLITHQENIGAGNARNVGLKSAIGDYVIFLDSDDIFYPNLLKTSYKLALKNKVDILVFDFKCEYSNGTSYQSFRNILFKKPYPINRVFSARDIPDNIFTFSKGVVWNKLFKRDFVIKNNLQFLDTKRHNDSFFVYTAYIMAKKIYVSNKVLLTYRRYNKNSTTSFYKRFKKESIEINLKKLKCFLVEKHLYNIYKNSYKKLIKKF